MLQCYVRVDGLSNDKPVLFPCALNAELFASIKLDEFHIASKNPPARNTDARSRIASIGPDINGGSDNLAATNRLLV
jgi:hypothetical protein